MRVSWKALSEWVAAPGPKEVAELLTARGIEVETLEDMSAGLGSVVVGKILDMKKHPEADRLTLCGVTLGGERTEIVCGAKNMKVGDHVVAALPGANLPNGLKIERSKIRGVVSNGMLCSESELGLASESEGIMILSQSTVPGTPIADVLGRNDTVLHLKPTANRGDCLGLLGVAREVAAAIGAELNVPASPSIEFSEDGKKVAIESSECATFLVVHLAGVKVGPSSPELAKKLLGFGVRSINNVVDAANLVMFELGHPVHTYDGKNVSGGLSARLARSGEALKLLDGRTLTLSAADLVIADGRGPVALAGVMGGEATQVQSSTTDLILEVADFDRAAVRRASRHPQLRTDALARFEKGIDGSRAEAVMARLVSLLTEEAGGRLIGAYRAGAGRPQRHLAVSPEHLSNLLAGSAVAGDQQQQRQILTSLAFGVKTKGKDWEVSVPGFRWDIERTEDLVDEIVRYVGFDAYASTVPELTSNPQILAQFDLMARAKKSLAGLGLLETISYSFTSRRRLAKFSETWAKSAIAIQNPMSEEQEVLVPSLLPGLVAAYQETRSRQFGSEKSPLGYFELRPIFMAEPSAVPGKTVTGVRESWRLSIVVGGDRFESALDRDQQAVDVWDLKGLVEAWLVSLGWRGAWKVKQGGELGAWDHVLHPGVRAEWVVGKVQMGVFGEVSPEILGDLKIKDRIFFADIDFDAVMSRLVSSRPPAFKAPATHPPAERDFAFLVPDGVSAQALVDLIQSEGKPLIETIRIFDRYAGDQVPKGMTSLALRVIFSIEGRSPTDTEIESVVQKLLSRCQESLGVKLRDR